MRIAMIAAMANNRVIGKDNKMPWHLPEDLRHFKAMTLSKPVVMGRKTYESIGRPFPLVLAAHPRFGDCEEIVVIGGGQLYQQLLPQADVLYLTLIDVDVEGDTVFPAWDDGSWDLQNSVTATNDKGLQYSFNTLVKKC